MSLVETWVISDVGAYLLYIVGLTLVIRLFLTLLKAQELSRDQFLRVWYPTFLFGRVSEKFDPHKTISDFWHPTILGILELAAYPILIATQNMDLIGAWLAFKTFGNWKHWENYRPAFNRFLIGNALNVLLALWLSHKFVEV